MRRASAQSFNWFSRNTGFRVAGIADRVCRAQQDYRELDDAALRKSSLALKYDAQSGRPLEQLLVPAFGLVREAARRTLGMEHYAVQLIGGQEIHRGRIAVMQTGEGKTLTATLPLYLHSLLGGGAHLITANDYLAARDAAQMKPLFEQLGQKVGVITGETSPEARRSAYASDITYATAKEIGFDFCATDCRRAASCRSQNSVCRAQDQTLPTQLESNANWHLP